MLASLTFSLVGTVVFALLALGLIWLMAWIGGGQRIHPAEGRAHITDGPPQRPGRPVSRRARR